MTFCQRNFKTIVISYAQVFLDGRFYRIETNSSRDLKQKTTGKKKKKKKKEKKELIEFKRVKSVLIF